MNVVVVFVVSVIINVCMLDLLENFKDFPDIDCIQIKF